MDPYQYLMLVSSFVLSIQLVPQNYKIYQNKSAKDISYITIAITLSGISGIMTYGIHMGLVEIWVPPIVQIGLTTQTLLMKIYYDKFNKPELINRNPYEQPDRSFESHVIIGIRNTLPEDELVLD